MEVSDVRWYRAAGYSHILKQRGDGAPTDGETPRSSRPAGNGLALRASAAYQKTMGSDATVRTAA